MTKQFAFHATIQCVHCVFQVEVLLFLGLLKSRFQEYKNPILIK